MADAAEGRGSRARVPASRRVGDRGFEEGNLGFDSICEIICLGERDNEVTMTQWDMSATG